MNGIITVLGCRKCGRCYSVCSAGALDRIDGAARVDPGKCTACMRCVVMCPNKALKFLE